MQVLVRDERGLSESVQYALIWPLLMLVTIGIIQAGIWVHGHNVAARAANAGADAARGSYGSVAEAERIAVGIARSGGLRGLSVAVSRGGADVDVTVTGSVPMIFDLGLGLITETASAPVERVSSP